MEIVKAILSTILSGIVADEAKAWLPTCSRALLQFALLRLPADQKERLAEEWAADLESFPGEVARLLRALGFVYASYQIGGLISTFLRNSARLVLPTRRLIAISTATFMFDLVVAGFFQPYRLQRAFDSLPHAIRTISLACLAILVLSATTSLASVFGSERLRRLVGSSRNK